MSADAARRRLRLLVLVPGLALAVLLGCALALWLRAGGGPAALLFLLAAAAGGAPR